MSSRTVPATTFKATCLRLLDEVERTRATIVVSKHGRAVAQLVPIDEQPRRPLEGSVTFVVDDEELLFSTRGGGPGPR
ncbi:MAG: type II toxin-antitoxin system Phd/YefM family antitoxin [Acidimicrobiia bacterium]